MGKENLWNLEFWKDAFGICPAAEFMQDLKESNANLHRTICVKIRRFYKDWQIEDVISRYLKPLGEGLFEYKITIGKIELRLFGIVEYQEGQVPRFLCFHCFFKKTPKLPKRELDCAMGRLMEYKN